MASMEGKGGETTVRTAGPCTPPLAHAPHISPFRCCLACHTTNHRCTCEQFPRLNLTVRPVAYAALVFNNCLDNGEPDERSLHEGVAPVTGVKYAINGWVRSKHLFG